MNILIDIVNGRLIYQILFHLITFSLLLNTRVINGKFKLADLENQTIHYFSFQSASLFGKWNKKLLFQNIIC